MFKEVNFGKALVVSFLIHLLVLFSWKPFRFTKIEPEKSEIEVTYVLPETPKEATIETLPKKYSLEKKKMQLKREEKNLLLEEEQQYREMENLEEYIAYYQLIREYIKRSIEKHHVGSREIGTVYVAFRLNRDGALKKVAIDKSKSTDSRNLKKTALKSVKSAQPFPPFPRVLNKKELVFSVAIIFKKE